MSEPSVPENLSLDKLKSIKEFKTLTSSREANDYLKLGWLVVAVWTVWDHVENGNGSESNYIRLAWIDDSDAPHPEVQEDDSWMW